MKVSLERLPRMWGWMLATIVATFAVWLLAPQQFSLVVYKVSLITLALLVGYWADRSLFSRVSDRLQKGMRRDQVTAARVIARALIVLAVVLGVTLGI